MPQQPPKGEETEVRQAEQTSTERLLTRTHHLGDSRQRPALQRRTGRLREVQRLVQSQPGASLRPHLLLGSIRDSVTPG